MSEAIEVQATVIDEQISPLASAQLWLAEASERVTERCERYLPPERIESEEQYKAVKAARAACRRDRAELDAERKAMTGKVDSFLKSFREQVKDVLSPLTDLDARYKALQDEYEELWRDNRQAELERLYQEIAPALVPLVSIEAIIRRYGSDRGRGWLNRSIDIECAKQSLAQAVEEIARGEKTIDELVSDEDDRVGIKAGYFQTLDIQVALNAAQEARERRERVERLERERREREDRQGREQGQMARDVGERLAARASAVESQRLGESDEALREAAEPTQARADSPHAWVISIPSATRAQAQSVADWMRANGIVFDRIYAGTLAAAYARETAHASSHADQ